MKSRRIWRTGLIALGILAGAWAFAALLLPVLWPFLIGLAVSLLAEKPVRLLQTRARFPRWLASGVCVLTLFVLLFGGAFFLCRLLCTEAADLARQLPQLAEGLAPPVLRLKDRLLSLAEKLPDGLGKGLRAGVESFFQNGAGFGSKLYESLFSWASGVIGGCRTRSCSRSRRSCRASCSPASCRPSAPGCKSWPARSGWKSCSASAAMCARRSAAGCGRS